MRALVLALALLAALKIWVQDSVYRAATEEALVSAYRARAAESCAGITAFERREPSLAIDWSAEGTPRIAVGNPSIGVRFWQFDHELWNARFRQPYLILSADTAGLSCTYDILAGTAEIARS